MRKQSWKNFWVNNTMSNIHVTGVPERAQDSKAFDKNEE